jgi:hypothetical protein
LAGHSKSHGKPKMARGPRLGHPCISLSVLVLDDINFYCTKGPMLSLNFLDFFIPKGSMLSLNPLLLLMAQKVPCLLSLNLPCQSVSVVTLRMNEWCLIWRSRCHETKKEINFFKEKLPDWTIELFTERVRGSCDGVETPMKVKITKQVLRSTILSLTILSFFFDNSRIGLSFLSRSQN